MHALFLCVQTCHMSAHRDFVLAPGQPVPLAVFPEQCVYRRQALAALTQTGRDWRIEYTSQSPVGIRVAVNQGFAATITGQRTLPPQWRILDASTGLPPLAPAILEVHRSPTLQHPAFDAFTAMIERVLRDG